MKKSHRSIAMQLLIALPLGCAMGLIFGPRIAPLGEVGVVIVTLLKTLATPLVFFAIVDAFCKTPINAKQGAKLLGLSLLNALVAMGIALSLCHYWPAADYVRLDVIKGVLADATKARGQNLAPPSTGGVTAPVLSARVSEAATPTLSAPGTLSPLSLARSLVPNSVSEPFATNNILAVVFLAILVGLAVRAIKNQNLFEAEMLTVEKIFGAGLAIIAKILEGIIKLIPVAVLCIVAKLTGTTGFGVFKPLGFFVIIVAAGMVLQVSVYYSVLIAVIARRSPLVFFEQAVEALLTAVGTGSSLATLPVTLRTLKEKMRVSDGSSRLAACVGTNLNHVGILLYEAVAVLFVAQIQGLSLSTSQQVTLATTSALAAVGIAGIPEAGLITLSLVLTAVGLPLAAVPLLLPVDWLIGRMRATTNVATDMTVAVLLDKLNS